MAIALTVFAPLFLLSLPACISKEFAQDHPPVAKPDAGEGARRSGMHPAKAKLSEGRTANERPADTGTQLAAADNKVASGVSNAEAEDAIVELFSDQIDSVGLGVRGHGSGGGGLEQESVDLAMILGAKGVQGGLRSGTSFGVQGMGMTGSTAPPTNRGEVWAMGENRESYADYGVNDMTLVEGDRFSTFAVDVDTASYAMARRKLKEGMLPDHASVRVEEFVNAVDYHYRAPGQGSDAPFAVFMEAAPSPWEPTHHVMRVAVQGMELTERPPVHLTFLVDTSGSMSQADKLPLAQEALMGLVEGLGPQDTVALGTYAGRTQMILGPTSASQGSAINAAIAQLQSGGGTAMSNGMEMAYQMASESYVHGHENRVVVLSDGDANIGSTSHEQILRTVQHHAEEGITLTTVGFGMGNYQDSLMEQLANKGDGNYFYVDTEKEARKVFGKDLAGTLVTIAKDVKIQVEFNPDAVIGYRLVGYENRDIADKDFRNDRVDAGEIGSGHAVTALYDVVLRDGAEDMELATVRLRAKKPGPDGAAEEWSTTFSPAHMHRELADASASLRLSVAVASFAELLRASPYAAELRYRDILKLAQGATLRGVDEHTELLYMIEKAAVLSGDAVGTLVSR